MVKNFQTIKKDYVFDVMITYIPQWIELSMTSHLVVFWHFFLSLTQLVDC